MTSIRTVRFPQSQRALNCIDRVRHPIDRKYQSQIDDALDVSIDGRLLDEERDVQRVADHGGARDARRVNRNIHGWLLEGTVLRYARVHGSPHCKLLFSNGSLPLNVVINNEFTAHDSVMASAMVSEGLTA